jgi:hypothetical protein
MVVAYLGWNSSSQGWNGGTWGNDVALPGSTGSVGSVSVTGTASVAVTGIAATGSPGAVTVTGTALFDVTGVSGTGQVGDVSELIEIDVDVPVTGLSATALVNSATILVWGGIVPDQNPEYSTITPSQTPVWTEIAA